MTNKNIPEQDDEWGNIELDGLDDKELYEKNWNLYKTEEEKARFSKIALEGYAKEGTEWRKKNLEHQRSKKDNPEWLANLSKTITEKQNQPEYLEHMSKQRLEAMDKVIPGENMTLREKITLANQESATNPVHHANRTAANRRLKNDPNWKKAHAKGVLKYSEAVITPHGEYQSIAKWIEEHNKPGGRSFLKSLPHLFYKVEDGPGLPTYERVYYTPYGKCAADKFAYDVCKSNNEPNAVKMRNIPGWWIKMATLYPTEYYIMFEEAKYWPIENDKPYGIDELEMKPRIKQDKLESMVETWNNRIANQKKMYKETK